MSDFCRCARLSAYEFQVDYAKAKENLHPGKAPEHHDEG